MQIGDFHIYTYEDVHHFFHYSERKDRYDKIWKELLNLKEPMGKSEIRAYLKRKMLCFFSPKILSEIFNLTEMDKPGNEAITRIKFCDYYFWLEEQTKVWRDSLLLHNQELQQSINFISPDLSAKRNDYLYIKLSGFRTFFKNTSRWRGEAHDITQLYIRFSHGKELNVGTFVVFSVKDSRLLNTFDSFQLSALENVALRLDLNQITVLEIQLFKKFNPIKRKQKDLLVAHCSMRLDSIMISKNSRPEILNVDLVETVDFHIEEDLKTKFNTILKEASWISSEKARLQHYLHLKYKKQIFCCCFEYRSLLDRIDYLADKKENFRDIDRFRCFCLQYGPFKEIDGRVFDNVQELADQYSEIYREYDQKEVTNPEVIGTMSFEMEQLRSEEEFLYFRRLALKREVRHNDFEAFYLKEKLLHLRRLMGTLGIIDSLNFFKNFSVCVRSYMSPAETEVLDDPIANLPLLREVEEYGRFQRELFHWLPHTILLLSILISFCRPDFLTVIIFLLIRPLTRYRWQMEHYNSAMFAIFWLICFEILWICLYYEDWNTAWYNENWRDFVVMAWVFSIINCVIKLFYLLFLATMAIREYRQI